MKRLLASAIVLLFASQGLTAEYLVKYKNHAAYQKLQELAALKSTGVQILDHHEPGSYFMVDLDETQKVLRLAELSADPNIDWIVPNFKLHAFAAPIETEALQNQWSIAKVQAEKAWARAGNKGNRNVIVAVIDTGVDYRHKNLAPNMIAGYDFRENDADPMDKTGRQNPGHGTHCAGAVGATGLIDGGIVGLSPEVSMMPIRFLGEDGSGDLNGGIKSIDFAIQKGAHIISASWGASVSRSQAQALLEAVKRADDAGVIFIAAAANDGRNNDTTEVYPANAGFPNTITVAASGPNDTKPSWSNFGKANVHVSSPGEGIISTLPGDKYGNLSGTSMATPLVSGLVALLKAQEPSLTGAQARALLQLTGAKVSIETACNCRVDAFNAVDHLMSKKMWMVPAAVTLAENESLTVGVLNGKAPYQFTSSNPSVVSVDSSGVVKALAKGSAQITVTDASGARLTSLDYHVGKSGGGGGGTPPGQPPGGGQPGQCPIGDQATCDMICGIMPDLPFCQK